ncbi:hypothetical protein M885DRAFT_48658 [Pelagophyceae sp. CCMP2097]|nr:hypothetical protein M885DRAFT_48658 [Pelagophyceae sp. CCMP2097]
MASAPRPAVQPQQFRGVLEKRGADGAWRIRTFSLQKHFLHYHEPGLDVAEHAPSATFDLRELRSVSVARKHGDRELSLVLDETRKHVLCECDPHAGPSRPTLEEWAAAIEDRVAIARVRVAKAVSRRDAAAARGEYYRQRIVRFYVDHNPSKVDEVDLLIAKYASAGVDVADLLDAIRAKFGLGGE